MVSQTTLMLCFFWLLLATARAFENTRLILTSFNKSHNINNIDTISALRMSRAARESYDAKQTSRKQSSSMSIANSGRKERTVVIMYHKPANVITSHSNADEISKTQSEQSRRTVYEDIYSMEGFVSGSSSESVNFETATNIHSKLHAIGRLDADTTGLLLLTNDGNLVHQVTNPTAKQANEQNNKPVQKTYQALIMGHHEIPASSTARTQNKTYPLLTLMEEGATLSQKHGGKTKPADDIKVLSHPTATTTLVKITISEGKNRQIRRMFHSVGSGVMKLHRVSIGNLNLSGLESNPKAELQEGDWRVLSDDEIRLGLGWKSRWIDTVPTDRRRSPRTNINGKRQLYARSARRRKKR